MNQDPKNAPFFVDNEVITLNREGIWIADGMEITHEPTRKLFARSLKKDGDGYYLHIGRETKRIGVEDTAYFVEGLEGSAKTGYEIRLSDQSQERLDVKSLKYKPGRLCCRIKSGSEEAKFLRVTYHQILRDLKEDGEGYFLVLENQRVQLAKK
ncbi:DUF1285 domain-containing protein [bacterium]|nr:DUF1285 domain-containing protein [bacterium]